MSVSTTSTLVTGTRKETVETVEAVEIVEVNKDGKESKGEYLNLAQVPCIRYLITFQKKSVSISALLDLGSEVNAIHPTLAWELGLPIKPMDIGVQKIDNTILDTFEMVVTAFLVTDKANRVKFFEETFLVANISPEEVFKMLFLTLSDADVDFSGRELRWKTYTTKEALPTTGHVKLVGKKEFAATALDPESETFIVHVASFSSDVLPSSSPLELDIDLSHRPWVSGLIVEAALMKVPAKYLDFADAFSPDLTFELLKHTRINNHAIGTGRWLAAIL